MPVTVVELGQAHCESSEKFDLEGATEVFEGEELCHVYWLLVSAPDPDSELVQDWNIVEVLNSNFGYCDAGAREGKKLYFGSVESVLRLIEEKL